ncbi:MAG: hypothetical protein AB7I38_02270 [Dehalococcoidia bacterium]
MTRDSAPRTATPSSGTRSGLGRLGSRVKRWDERGRLTLLGLTLVALIGIGGAVWGGLFASPDVQVQDLDAGPVSGFAIGKVVPYPEVNVYVVGIEDGRIRAIDGIVRDSGCAVRWDPADDRTRQLNPAGAPGSYTDPCSGNVWTSSGNAFAGADAPLRTFQVTYETNDEGVQHVWVEVIGDRSPRP